MALQATRDSNVDLINIFSRNADVIDAERDIVQALISDDSVTKYAKINGGSWETITAITPADVNKMVPFVFPTDVIHQKACYLFEAVETKKLLEAGASEEIQEYTTPLNTLRTISFKKSTDGSSYYNSSVYCKFTNINNIYDKSKFSALLLGYDLESSSLYINIMNNINFNLEDIDRYLNFEIKMLDKNNISFYYLSNL